MLNLSEKLTLEGFVVVDNVIVQCWMGWLVPVEGVIDLSMFKFVRIFRIIVLAYLCPISTRWDVVTSGATMLDFGLKQ